MKWIDFLKSILIKGEQTESANNQKAPSDWDRAWQHAKDAYQNVQSTIQFVDTKTSVLVGIITVVTAGVASLPFAMLSLDLEKKKEILRHLDSQPCLKMALCVLWFITLVPGVIALICALLSTIARLPNHIKPLLSSTDMGKELERKGSTILFPLTESEDWSEIKKSLSRLNSELEYELILSEYRQQLLITGGILFNKIKYNRRAVKFLIAHILLASILVLLIAVTLI